MTNVPRRLPPTQGQRIRNVTVTHASLSGQGRTAAARPVVQQRPTARIYQPSSLGWRAPGTDSIYLEAQSGVTQTALNGLSFDTQTINSTTMTVAHNSTNEWDEVTFAEAGLYAFYGEADLRTDVPWARLVVQVRGTASALPWGGIDYSGYLQPTAYSPYQVAQGILWAPAGGVVYAALEGWPTGDGPLPYAALGFSRVL